MDIMKELTDGKLDETLKYYRSGFYKIDNQRVYISELDLLENLAMKFFV